MDIRRINDAISVSPQISVADIVTLKAAGFTTVINNRPDGESDDQPSTAEIRAAAEEAGLSYFDIPMGREGVSPDMIKATQDALASAGGPVLAFCRSGTRSATLWSLSQAGQKPANEIIEAAAEAGYDMSHLAAHLG